MYDVSAIGEILIDFTPVGLSDMGHVLYEQNPGGGPPNMLSSCSRLGLSCAFAGRVGNDAFGTFLKGTLEKLKIDTHALSVDPEVHTTLAFVHLDEKGGRSFSFYRKPGADANLSKENTDISHITDAKIFHFSTVAMTSTCAYDANIAAVALAKQKGALISFDPNLRLALWDSKEEAKRVILKGLSMSDIVKISDEEVAFLCGSGNLLENSRTLRQEYRNALMFVTKGPEGCMVLANNGIEGNFPAIDVPVVDTTGCGDAFLGGALFALIQNDISPHTITQSEADMVASFASASGSFAAMKRGGIPSMGNEVQIRALLRRQI